MSEVGFRDHRNESLLSHNAMSPEGRWALVLGMFALMMGVGAAAAGAYIGFGTSARLVPLPGGLPSMEAETVAIMMFACGAITMLLGVVSIYRANEN
jgi:hypothetical protein